jgi:hypothetical protein
MTHAAILSRFNGVRRSGHGHVALCPAHNDHKRSLSIGETTMPRVVNGATINVLAILLHCFAGCTVRSICEGAGITVRDLFDFDHRNDGRGVAGYGWSDEQRREWVRAKFWLKSKPARGTVVETYLHSRGINIPIPPSIRFLPSLLHRDYGWPFPALVAGIQDGDGGFAAVSLTWLAADGSGKAPVGQGDERRILGPYRGGAVRLTNQADTRIAIGEGIETMLSVQQATGLPCWAALSANNLANIRVPASIREIYLAPDNDATGVQAAQRAALRLMAEGHEVRIARPFGAGADFNDLLMRGCCG